MRSRSDHRPILRAVAVLLAAGLLAGGCGDDDRASQGTLTLRVSDAPYPFAGIESATLTIDRVEVYVDADADEESAFYVLTEEARTLDLMELRNGATEVLTTTDLPVGNVDQIRVRVVAGSVTLADGRTFDLRVPSGDASGLKIFPRPAVILAADSTVEVLLDFDVSESFRCIPASARRAADIHSFQFHPVLRVANLEATGSLSGLVLRDAPLDPDGRGAPVPYAGVEAVLGAEVVRTSTDRDGRWALLGLPRGLWEVRAVAVGYGDARTDVRVEPGQETHGVSLVLPAD